MSMVQVMDLTVVCQSFPHFLHDMVKRENILDTIQRLFNEHNNIIIIEGREGLGKTTLLAQFARENADNSISLFIKPASRYSYDPNLLKLDLYSQIYWALNGKDIKNTNKIEDLTLGQIFWELNRFAKRKRDIFYFVIDGIDEIPKEREYMSKVILEMLPLGLSQFKFIFSGSDDSVSNILKNTNNQFKSFPLSGFTTDETSVFFSNLNNKDHIDEIHKTCGGIPGHLSSVKRLLKTGIEINDVILEMSDKLPELFELEWRQTNIENSKVLDFLAMLANDIKKNSIEIYSMILSIETEELRGELEKITFVEINRTNEVNFVSVAFEKFVGKKLSYKKEESQNKLIDFFLKNPQSNESLENLPTYLKQAGRLDELIDYLTPDLFSNMLKITQSISSIQQHADLGINASLDLGNDSNLVRFSLHKSILFENNGAKIWNSEIKARMSVNQYENAIALTRTTLLIEERLHMLVIIARYKKEQGFVPDEELLIEIEKLFERLDISVLNKEKTISIASDLLYINPELAIDLIEKVSSNDGGENSLDWALASLSLVAINGNNDSGNLDFIEDIRLKMKDPDAKRFATESSLLMGNYNAKEILSEVKKLDNASEQLYLLSNWAISNDGSDNVEEVLDYSFKLSVKITDYAPNANVYNNLAKQLINVKSEDKLMEFIDFLDGQKYNIENAGPTEDYIGLQLSIAEVEGKNSAIRKEESRLIDIMLYIIDIQDTSTKASCLAKFISIITEVDSENLLEKSDELHSWSYEELRNSINIILVHTAEHYHELKQIIEALGKSNPNLIIEMIKSINIEKKRDLAYFKLVETLLENKFNSINLKQIKSIITEIADPDQVSNAVMLSVEKIYRNVEGTTEELIMSSMIILDSINLIIDLEDKCRACCMIYVIVRNNKKLNSYKEKMLEELKFTWDNIDIGWRKVDIGFKIVSLLADSSLETAKEYLEFTVEYREQLMFDDPNLSWAYITCAKLLIQSFGGLLPKNLNEQGDLDRIIRIIDIIPSSGEKSKLYSYLALGLYKASRLNEFKQIVTNYVKPCLEKISMYDKNYRNHVIIRISPSLYFNHKLTTFELLNQLSVYDKDSAIHSICYYIIYKYNVIEPYDDISFKGNDLSYLEITDICELVNYLEDDGLIYYYIKLISNIITTKSNLYSREQLQDVANRISKIIEIKLPNNRHIKHEGFKIAALAQLAKIRKESTQGWINLIERARKIPNSSDKAYVLSIILGELPRKERGRRDEIIKEVDKLISEIPGLLDQMERYESLASILVNTDTQISKKYLKKGIELAINNESNEIFNEQRRIIDLAHKIDPEFAGSLVSLTDNDEARRSNRFAKSHLKTLELKNKISKSKMSEIDQKYSPYEYVQATWRLLGGLNANRVENVHIEQTREYVKVASELSLTESYPIYSWVIENAIKRYSNSEQAVNYIRPMYDACAIGAEMSVVLSGKNSSEIKKLTLDTESSKSIGSVLIKSGQREKALEYIENWLKDNLGDYIKICDPYFGQNDLEILRIIKTINPKCKVEILTSKKHQMQENVEQPFESSYRDFWRIRISDQEPPDTFIVIVGTQTQNELPIHDRWWFTSNGGIRMGTSYHSLGHNKDSEISILTSNEVEIREQDVDLYLNRLKKEHNQERLSYTMFNL